MLLLLLCGAWATAALLAGGAAAADAAVTSSAGLYAALANPAVSLIVLNSSITLAPGDWAAGVAIRRDVVVAAAPTLLTAGTFVQVDWSGMAGVLSLASGTTLTFHGLELVNHISEVGAYFKPLAYTSGPSATRPQLVWERVVSRRRAGLPLEPTLNSMLGTARLGGGAQLVYTQQDFCLSVTGKAGTCYKEAMTILDWAAYLPADQTFSGGGYDFFIHNSTYVVDNAVLPSCYVAKPESAALACVVAKLAELDAPPPSDNNNVDVSEHACMCMRVARACHGGGGAHCHF